MIAKITYKCENAENVLRYLEQHPGTAKALGVSEAEYKNSTWEEKLALFKNCLDSDILANPDNFGFKSQAELPAELNSKDTKGIIESMSADLVGIGCHGLGIASAAITVTLDETMELLENTTEFVLFKAKKSYHKDNLLRTGVLNGNEEYIRIAKGNNITYTIFYNDGKTSRFEDGSRVTCLDSQGKLLKQKINKMLENLNIRYKTNAL